MSKGKEEGKRFISLYKTLYKFNTDPGTAAGFQGAKYGQAIMDAVDSGQTLAGLTKDQQIYMLEVMKNILYPKSESPEEEGGSIPNLEFLKNLPKSFTDSLNESARSLLESYIQVQDSISNSSTTSVTTTSVSTTLSSNSSIISATTKVTIDEVIYNTKITIDKVELSDLKGELVCTAQIENGQVKLIYSLDEIYTVDKESGWFIHNTGGAFSGYYPSAMHKKNIIETCEKLLKNPLGNSTSDNYSSSSSSSSSTSEPKTTTTVSTTTLPLGGDPIDGESMSPTVTTTRALTTISTSHSSTILFSPLDPIIAATEDTSPELIGQSLTTDAEYSK